MDFDNVYEDSRRAESYASLEFPGTYYLAYRDLPAIIRTHVTGTRALDFGCGAGRSTRFLEGLGYQATGVDISADMLEQARQRDPKGEYLLVDDSPAATLSGRQFDLVLAVFTFDNVPTMQLKVSLFSQFGALLAPGGRIVSLVSSPEIYTHEWASFTTKDFPENKLARSGDKVKIIMTDVADRRPVEDVLWSDDAYRDVYRQAGLKVVEVYRPLGREDEPYKWVNETTIGPWVIYVLERETGTKLSG